MNFPGQAPNGDPINLVYTPSTNYNKRLLATRSRPAPTFFEDILNNYSSQTYAFTLWADHVNKNRGFA